MTVRMGTAVVHPGMGTAVVHPEPHSPVSPLSKGARRASRAGYQQRGTLGGPTPVRRMSEIEIKNANFAASRGLRRASVVKEVDLSSTIESVPSQVVASCTAGADRKCSAMACPLTVTSEMFPDVTDGDAPDRDKFCFCHLPVTL